MIADLIKTACDRRAYREDRARYDPSDPILHYYRDRWGWQELWKRGLRYWFARLLRPMELRKDPLTITCVCSDCGIVQCSPYRFGYSDVIDWETIACPRCHRKEGLTCGQ